MRFRGPVDRRTYLAWGFGLMALKYALEASIVFATTGRAWPPWVFLSPIASLRANALPEDASAVLVLLAATSLPFLFVGLSLSVRRAADAGRSPWLGLGFLLPFLNFVFILVLAVLPSRTPVAPGGGPSDPAQPAPDGPSLVRASLVGIAVSLVLGVTLPVVAASLGAYGSPLFFGLPVLMGIVVGVEANRRGDRGFRRTAGASAVAGVATALSLLLFAVEGAICIGMVLPLALPLVVLGGEIGRQIALLGGRRGGQVAACLALPVVGIVEPTVASRPLHHVVTVVEVDAPTDVVFQHVVSFTPIRAARPWYFRTGIAVPLSARIEGTGVGAVRHCEFTTGAFVEPITAWEPGRRLAFDVVRSPAPMEEWSPYRHLHPPHLDTTMRSRRGEFRLSPLPGGRTRLEGHTYYELGLRPEAYFSVLSDELVHRIHARVLEHVAREAEAQAATRTRRGGASP